MGGFNMLTELYIKNLAVIEEIRAVFKPGLTIVSGEEGSGKSLLVDALCLLMGGRASTSFIRNGASAAFVEGVFWVSPDDKNMSTALREAGIDIEADGTLILSREVQEQGRSIARANGKAVPLALLRELGQRLMDIHGQMEHVSLLNPQRQMDILDGYAHLLDDRSCLESKLAELNQKTQKLNTLTCEQARSRRELLEYQVSEIASANVRPGEDEALQRERQVLQQAHTIKEGCYTAYAALYADDRSATSLLHHAEKALHGMASIDPALTQQLNTLESVRAELEQTARELRYYADALASPSDRLEQIEQRLELLRHLKSKYGPTLEHVLEFANQGGEELELIQEQEEQRFCLEEEQHALEIEAAEIALALSRARQDSARRLKEIVNEELADLGMPWARFDIRLIQDEHSDGLPTPQGRYACTQYGIDRIEFMASTNPGEPLRPLAEIASGGETCRFMLALKSSLQYTDPVPLLVFDEIDIGIGGRSAHTVGKRLASLARTRQVICITHLPQIACYGHNHYRVQKDVASGRAVTRVEHLGERHRLDELAMMLGSREDAHMLRSAEELLRRAKKEELERTTVRI
jgi:DNA repair protein RecN (Recombination protein N)